jgi:hypothetical protein
VASVEFVSNGSHGYTGLFEGADYGIVRLSDGGFLHEGMTSFDPSAAMKFFVDERSSRDLLARANFGGSNESYFFDKPFSTNPPGATSMNDCS